MYQSQLKLFSPYLLRVPSPLVGEGQGEGVYGHTTTGQALTPTLSRRREREKREAKQERSRFDSSYGINTNFPVDCRDSIYRCASAASASGNRLPMSSLSFPSRMSWNDLSMPSWCLSGMAETV